VAYLASPRPNANAPRKEAVYVRIALPDGSSSFYPATDYVGKQMPFDKPREICAMRVMPDIVAFSLRHLTKAAIKEARLENLRMPSNALTRLCKKVASIEGIDAGVIVVEHNDVLHRLRLSIDDNGVASIEPEGEDVPFELDVRGERISVYFRSAVRDRLLCLGFQGHIGKPGTVETVSRCAAKALNAALGLPEFQLLAGMVTVPVPSKPGVNYVAVRTEALRVEMPVRCFDEAFEPVAAGEVLIDVDLQHANVNADRLLFTVEPGPSVVEHFGAYVDIVTRFVTARIPELLGEEVRGIALDITLGEVDQATVTRLSETLRAGFCGGVDVTPSKFRAQETVTP
jgi:hypothetical protein